MATTQRQYPGAAVNGGGAKGSNLSGATTGIKLTYTVPIGRQARLTLASALQSAGAATIVVELTLAGVSPWIALSTTSISLTGGLMLDAGDTVKLRVTVLDAASLFDGVISVEEYLAQ